MNTTLHSRHRSTRRTKVAVHIGAALTLGAVLVGCESPAVPTVSGTVQREAPAADFGDDGGRLPAKISVNDEQYAAVAKLRPQLRKALQAAAADAGEQGVEILVTAGWRSADYQRELLEEAVQKYGSKRQAAKWVADPAKSAHVSGDAVDLGPMNATDWLAQRGAKYGLCQTYANESWHYELRPTAKTEGCPEMYADPTEDPRMK